MNDEKIKILIVEDDVFIAENLNEVLQDLGYSIADPCSTLNEALACLEREVFDLAILDINLNGKDDGIDIGKHIAVNYGIPFIFLTAFTDSKTIDAAAKTNPNAYLVKPISPMNLFASIQIALHNNKNNLDYLVKEGHTIENDFFVKVGNKIIQVIWEEVICINAGKNYVTIQIGKENFPDYPIRSSLLHVVKKLIPKEIKDNFVQINRSQYFNIKFFKEIKKEWIITSFGEFELGEKYKKELKERLNIIR